MTTWVRVDTKFISHPKVLDIGPVGESLWLRGLCYAGEQLTDGFIPLTFIKRMGDMKGLVIAERLVAAGLWDETDDGYQIHDYLDWQRSRDEVGEISSKRAEAGRRGGKQKASNLLANGQQTDSKLSSKTLPDTDTEAETDTPQPPEGDEYSADFELFWMAYPNKKRKGYAWIAWKKAKGRPPIPELIAAVHKQSASAEWRKDNGAFVPHPATWLNGRGWDDEVKPAELTMLNGMPPEIAKLPYNNADRLRWEQARRDGAA